MKSTRMLLFKIKGERGERSDFPCLVLKIGISSAVHSKMMLVTSITLI